MNDLVCLSHLRWDFVFQRPQQLMTRAALDRRVFFVEEPEPTQGEPRLEQRHSPDGVTVCVPHLPLPDLADGGAIRDASRLLERLTEERQIVDPVLWHYTPMMEPLTRGLAAAAVIYDCMDELTGFAFAPPELLEREAALLRRADLVFTGGWSLYEAKRDQHPRVYAFPSSVDVEHWRAARGALREPEDLQGIPGPRLVYLGVIDERMDLELLSAAAGLRPDWQWLLLGPIVKIDPADLPDLPNLHALGMKRFAELPAYLAYCDVALMPFARNPATRFISPTKTPEYLAAGLPVVSTPILDVVRSYGGRGLVEVAETPEEWITACERTLAARGSPADAARQERADELLATTSWDETWEEMDRLVRTVHTVPAETREAVAVG